MRDDDAVNADPGFGSYVDMMNVFKLSDTECVDMLNKSRSFVSRIQQRLEMFTLRIIQINYY